MIRSIQIGTDVFVQGVFVGAIHGGLIKIRVGQQIFTGRPVTRGA
jgi:hypothetical protein